MAIPPATSQSANFEQNRIRMILLLLLLTHPLPTYYRGKDFAAILLADVVSASHRHLPHETDRKLESPIVRRQGSVNNSAKTRDKEEGKKRPSTAKSADGKGNGPAWDLDKSGEEVADKDVVRTQVCHVLCLTIVTHESHHAEIDLCGNKTMVLSI